VPDMPRAEGFLKAGRYRRPRLDMQRANMLMQ
jgi:hypothetical protein